MADRIVLNTISYHGHGAIENIVPELTVPFYQRCGFTEHHRVKNFFLDNYDHPIVECGVTLCDMVYLSRPL